MSEARVIRRKRFRARHRYLRDEWSTARNEEVFGAHVEPHEHDWTVELRLLGRIDPETGFAVDLQEIDSVLEAAIGTWEGVLLNDLLAGKPDAPLVPSTEALARWLFTRLGSEMPGGARLERVAVFESDELGSEFPP